MSDILKNFAQMPVKEAVVPYGELDPTNQELLCAAHAVRLRAYAPYSNFKVGAAFRPTENSDLIFTGCNVENASFTPTSCAERTALTKAVSEGYRQFLAGAVIAYNPDQLTTPCGVCRQFIREFAGDTDIPIYIAQAHDTATFTDQPFSNDHPVFCTTIFNLLPWSFRSY